MTFDTFNLSSDILKAIAEAGYLEPTDIQMTAIPKVLEGLDLRASAQTGTGKTAAFLLPALECVKKPKTGKGPRVLILVPTRELGTQIAEQSKKYSKHLPHVKTVSIGGGVPYHKQIQQLSRPYDILIATPGRLMDYMQRKKIAFPRLEMLVLDEADRMLDMGFIGPVKEIAAATPDNRQTLLFSATLRKNILKLSNDLLNDPEEIIIHAEKEKHENIKQKLHFVNDLSHKNKVLEHILGEDDVSDSIIFTATKRHADQLTKELKSSGHKAAALHGDMRQRQRTRTIADLKKGRFNVLVATDVAARGIDVQSISHVINFDLPRNTEDYVHRIGRTGRAGSTGTALSLVSGREAFLVKQIEKYTGQRIDTFEIPGLEPKKQSFKPSGNKGPRKPGGNKRRFGGPPKGKSFGGPSGRGKPFNKKRGAGPKRGPR